MYSCKNRAPFPATVEMVDGSMKRRVIVVLRGLTQERLKEFLSYDPETGLFTKNPVSGSRGRMTKPWVYGLKEKSRDRYLRIPIDGKRYLAHRLAFLYMSGRLPDLLIDHIDGDVMNNRWANLREATYQQNTQANHRPNRNNTSGYRGVTWDKDLGKWRAQISVDGVTLRLGCFTCPIEASRAYQEVKSREHFR